MDIEKHLILVKGEDVTEQITFCEYIEGNWRIIFHNTNKEYHYGFNNVERFFNPKVLNHEIFVVYEHGIPISGIVKILDFGHYIRVIYETGYKKIYERSRIIIAESCLTDSIANNCFEYLKKLADITSVKIEDDTSFLSKQYNDLNFIHPQSALAAYLERMTLAKMSWIAQSIFPFGFNLSQKDAIEKALSEQLSVIEGPPGTGKTQTILNIIANAIVNNKTVAVVSNNNSATANVLEKLQKCNLDFIVAFLGNNENKEKFFNEQNDTYPDMSSWVLSYSNLQLIKAELIQSQQKLNIMLETRNKLALLNNQLSGLQTELEYFNKYNIEVNEQYHKLGSFYRFDSDKIISIMFDYNQKITKGNISLIDKLYFLFVYRILRLDFFNNAPEEIISLLQKTYYVKKISEIQNQIKILSDRLKNYNFDKVMHEHSVASMKLFKARLVERYGVTRQRNVFQKDVLWKDFEHFIDDYPVILSTTHSLRRCVKRNYLFDYVIIDEASQVDLVTGALALSCAKSAVIVGDIKQLSHVIPSDVARVTKQIFQNYELNNAYSYSDNSLLSSVISLFSDIPRTLLREHYRCHPKIIGFCNQKFYNNQLIILTTEHEEDQPLVLYKTTKGKHARGRLNQRQIDVVFEEIIPEQNIDDEKQSVGIVSPYRLQANELKKAIGKRNIEADTIHKYQGREKDIVIITTVENEITANDFVDNPNMINVAVSRAVDKLIVVVSEGSEEWKSTNIGDLVRYIQYNNFEIIESQLSSVFDMLYKCYSEKLLEILKSNKIVSQYNSENLINIVIEKVLSIPEFQNLGRLIHYPLAMLIKDLSKLSDEEQRYATNISTHVDFVIFNKVDKMPVLVVEIDGYAYHANNPYQLKRDEMKDAILQKYNIPILRIKTNESCEERKIRQKLMELLRIKK